MRLHMIVIQVVQMMTAPLPQDLGPLGIPTAAAAPAVSEMGHDGQCRVRASRHVDEARHACNCEFVEDVVGSVDCGEDDPVGEEAAGDVIQVCPAGAEFIAFEMKVLAEAVVDFAGGVGGWVLGSSVEPEPIAHDVAHSLFRHAEVLRAFHVWEPYVLKVLVSKGHGVEPNVEVEEENAVDCGGALVCRCVEYEFHGISEGFVCREGLFKGVVGEVELVLIGSETWHADMYLSEEWFVSHYCRYSFWAISVDSNESHAVLKR